MRRTNVLQTPFFTEHGGEGQGRQEVKRESPSSSFPLHSVFLVFFHLQRLSLLFRHHFPIAIIYFYHLSLQQPNTNNNTTPPSRFLCPLLLQFPTTDTEERHQKTKTTFQVKKKKGEEDGEDGGFYTTTCGQFFIFMDVGQRRKWPEKKRWTKEKRGKRG